MITSSINWLIDIIEKAGYVGVGFAMFIESFFAPIPSELIMPFAGFLTVNGDMNLSVLILLGGIASYLGSLPFYLLGLWGNEWVEKFLNSYGKYLFIQRQDVQKGFNVFHKYGKGIVLVGRIIPIIRTVISFPAGVAKMPFFEFTLYTLIGSTVWSGFLASAGYFLGDNWKIVEDWISQYEHIILILGIIAVVTYIGRGIYNLRKK